MYIIYSTKILVDTLLGRVYRLDTLRCQNLLNAFDEHAMSLDLVIIPDEYAILTLLPCSHGLALDMNR